VVPHTCDQCGANVAAEEQFCPECGSYFDPVGPPPSRAQGDVISVSSDGTYEEFSLGDQPPADDVAAGEAPPTVSASDGCPSCGAANPPSNRHCQECGARLSQAPLPTAPRPAVQTTAGVRAALAISGLLLVVVVFALLFNVIGGGGSATSTTTPPTSTTKQTVQEAAMIEVIDAECSHDGIGSFACDNLKSGNEDEYQINWDEADKAEEDITIKLTFRSPMTVNNINWKGIADAKRFKQNYRARGITVKAADSIREYTEELDDTPGAQNVRFAAINTNWIEITVNSAYIAQVVDDNSYSDLAIDEIEVWGYDAPRGDG